MGRKRQVKRGQNKRPEKTVVLIGTEGNNKTERKYFYALGQTVSDKYCIRFAGGNSTDPVGIVRDTAKSKGNLCTDPGDVAFAVFDTDADSQKQMLISDAVDLANKNEVAVITSTPCFEVWFLQHFRFSTHAFRSNAEVISELQKYIPGYKKNSDVFSIIAENTSIAMENAKALEVFHDGLGRMQHSIVRNPSTEVFRVVEEIMKT